MALTPLRPSPAPSVPKSSRKPSNMRTFAIAALVGTTLAAPATVFTPGQAPKCFVSANGATIVEYTSKLHAR